MSESQSAHWSTLTQNQSRLGYGLAVTDIAARDDSVVAISSDTVDLMGLRELANAHPHRVIEAGIAEQNAMGIASGLATTGMRPFLSGYAPFITARSMEQLRNDVAYANQRVVIGASCSGITLGVSGGTHHALEDIALMRCMPNMTVLVPADANQAWHLTQAASALDGPSYIRLGGRAEETVVTAPDAHVSIGKADLVQQGNDVTIIACGVMVALAIDAAKALASDGINARVLNMHSIKPLDHDAVLAAASETTGIVCAEEHRISGGLGDAVAQLLAVNHPSPMRFVGMPDEFAIVGPTDRVRERYGMSAANITTQCKSLLK